MSGECWVSPVTQRDEVKDEGAVVKTQRTGRGRAMATRRVHSVQVVASTPSCRHFSSSAHLSSHHRTSSRHSLVIRHCILCWPCIFTSTFLLFFPSTVVFLIFCSSIIVMSLKHYWSLYAPLLFSAVFCLVACYFDGVMQVERKINSPYAHIPHLSITSPASTQIALVVPHVMRRC